jgi:sugar lactone lactonase YvrE
MKKIILIVLVLSAYHLTGNAQIITTIAGNGTIGFFGDGLIDTLSKVNAACGVATDAAGNIYIADQYNNRIRKISASTHKISTVAGNNGTGYNGDNILADSAKLNTPVAVAVDDSGNVYIADKLNNRIRKVTALTGLISTIAGTGVAGYNGDGILADSAKIYFPSGVAVDASRNVYIADQYNSRIRKITVSTGIISTFAGTDSAGFNGDGKPADSARLGLPSGIAIDGSGNLFIADQGNNRIRKVDVITDTITTVVGSGSQGYNGDGIDALSAQLYYPHSIAINSAGDIFISDFNNARIRKVSISTNLISTVAGNGTFGYNGDHILATSAELNGPHGIALDFAGNLYIADEGNSRIRMVDLTVGIPEINSSSNGLNIYRNPSTGDLTMISTLSEPLPHSTIGIYDVMGQIAFRKDIGNLPKGYNSIEINIPRLASGVYLIELSAGEKHFLKKLIITK